MKKVDNTIEKRANRRSFLKKGVAAAGVTASSPARARSSRPVSQSMAVPSTTAQL